jgi:hypothetical protein
LLNSQCVDPTQFTPLMAQQWYQSPIRFDEGAIREWWWITYNERESHLRRDDESSDGSRTMGETHIWVEILRPIKCKLSVMLVERVKLE